MKSKLAALIAGIGVAVAGAFFALPGQAATTQIYTTQACLPDGSVRVNFSWSGNDPNASQQWLDLSLFNNDWQWGTFLGAGPLHAGESALRWDGLIPNATHYIRVNQLLTNGVWDPSPTFFITTINCAPPPPPPSDRIRVPAPIDDADVVHAGGSAYYLNVQAGLPSGCAKEDGYTITRTGNDFTVEVWNTMPAGNPPCTLIYGMYDLSVPLGTLQSGMSYRIFVNDEVVEFMP